MPHLNTEDNEEIINIVMNQTVIGICIVQNYKIVFINETYIEKTGYSFEEVKEWNFNELANAVHPEDRAFVVEQVQKKQNGEKDIVLNYQFRSITKAGKIKWLDLYSKPINFRGKPAILVTFIDITDKKEAEKKYEEAYNLMNFFNNLFAHDMNNILQNIKSSVEYYGLFRNDPERLKELGDIVDVVRKHANRGKALISTVRKLLKIDNQNIKIYPVEVASVLNKAIDHIKTGFQHRTIDVDIKGLTEELVVMGNELLIDVFENILNNAVKFTDISQDVKISILISNRQENGTKRTKFEFKDCGIGIANEKKKTLFKKLYSEDLGDRGMGMGLSLVKNIVERYGGEIKVQDRVKGNHKKGSNFIVDLLRA